MRGSSRRPAPPPGAFGQPSGPPGYYLAYTQGDAVGKVSNKTELTALYPTIDTPAKALLYANAAGYRVECHHATGWIREEPDGWVMLTSRDHEQRCARTDVVLFLRRDGTTEERDLHCRPWRSATWLTLPCGFGLFACRMATAIVAHLLCGRGMASVR